MSKQAYSRSLPKYIVLQKKRGETPLHLLQAWKQEQIQMHPEYATVPLSYAGRLDPMAEGKLLMLIGDECKNQAKYTKLDKEYEVVVLLGAKTDTGDLLGLIKGSENKSAHNIHSQTKTTSEFTKKQITRALAREVGSFSRQYPLFSSKTVHGKPLFLYALEGTVKDIQIPEHIETILKIRLQKVDKIQSAKLQEEIAQALSVVPRSEEASKKLGEDFRQDAVRESWHQFFSETQQSEFTLMHIRVTCRSGAYMRTLAERIGRSLGVPALAFSINRTKIGKYGQFPVAKSLGFWIKKF